MLDKNLVFLIFLIFSYIVSFLILLKPLGYNISPNIILFLLILLIFLDYFQDKNILKRYNISMDNLIKGIPIAIIASIAIIILEVFIISLELQLFHNQNLYIFSKTMKLGSTKNKTKIIFISFDYLIKIFGIFGFLLFIISIFFIAFFEEYVFRGVILHNLSKHLPRDISNIIQAIVFGTAHILNIVGPLNPLTIETRILYFSATFLQGLILGIITEKMDGIMASTATHTLYNLFITLLKSI